MESQSSLYYLLFIFLLFFSDHTHFSLLGEIYSSSFEEGQWKGNRVSYVAYFHEECYSGQDCSGLSGGGCLLLRCIQASARVAGNSPPHPSTYWALPNLFLLVSRENLPGQAHAHSHWAIPLFFPLWNSGWCFSTWGPQAYSWGFISSTKSFECSVFTFGSPRWPHQNQLLLHHIKPAFPFGLRSCSWQMNQCAISLKTNASPEFKERKMARELCGLTRWWTLQLLIFFPPNLQQYALAVKCSKNNKRILLNTFKNIFWLYLAECTIKLIDSLK